METNVADVAFQLNLGEAFVMTPHALIQTVRKQNRLSLTEAESKILLSHYGVSVVAESIVSTETGAIKTARKIGYPVVLKAVGANLTHKTERGLVKVGLRTGSEVRSAFRFLKEATGADWEGCLVQPLILGKREFVAGLMRDDQFGPVVMFGLGGVFTEAFKDVAFRIAPIDQAEADRMINALATTKLLGGFRGESPANHRQLMLTLTGLSRLAIDLPEIAEVDINPLIIGPDGLVTAVDALIVLSSEVPAVLNEPATEANRRDVQSALASMIRPKSIAVVGAKRTPGERFRGIFDYISNFGFAGRLYPINPSVDEIAGYKAYPNLVSVPEPVDLVIVSVPAKSVPEVLKDCTASGSRQIHIFSSGFNETGDAAGTALHREIETIAREGKLHVVGPNCMGLYVPSSRIVTWPWALKESGPLAFISQSGGNAQDFTRLSSGIYGLFCSKVISYGNALTLDCTDFLEFLETDAETRVIGMYLEGVKDGRKLLDLVRRINRKKPVIILKAGLTESGARAVASHTGSMAGGEKIWEAFFEQSGAVQVDCLDEVSEMALAFLKLGKCNGRRVCILGTGGGVGVAAADECTKAGLELPNFSPELTQELQKFIPAAGNMIRNPVDAHLLFFDDNLMNRALDLIAAESAIDMFIISMHLDWLYSDSHESADHLTKVADYLANEARKHLQGKPLIVVWRQYQNDPEIHRCLAVVKDILLSAGIPFYHGLTRGANVLSKLASYHEFQWRLLR